MTEHHSGGDAHLEELGGIRSWWASITGEPSRCVGRADEMTKEQAIAAGHRAAERARLGREAETRLRNRNPQAQLFHGYLPSPEPDVAWSYEPGWYFYVLSTRRRNGQYQVKDFEKVEQ